MAPNAQVVQQIGATVTSVGAGTAARQINLGGLPGVAGTGSYWFIGCDLPPNTGILSYYVDEQQ